MKIVVAAEYLLDASALLAFLRREPGWDVVLPALDRSAITSVNLYEVLTKAVQLGIGWEDAAEAIDLLALTIVPFSEENVDAGRRFAKLAWTGGYSLGDRICLSAGAHLGFTILTADRKWQEVAGVRLKPIR